MDSLHLKWSNHYQHVSTTFRHIFDDEAFTDVTIVCRDGSVRAHKLVLTSCSAFFRRVFAENPSAQMVFMVRGACVADVRTLMEFAYKGDVRISRDEVNRLGELAEDLEFGEFWKVVENAVSENVVATEIKEEELMIEVEEMDAEEEKEKFVFLENLEIRAADETQTLTIKTESPGNDEIQQASMVSPSHSTRSGNSTSCSSKTQKKSEADEETTKDDSELEEKAEAAKRRNLILTCKICKQKFKNTKLLSLHIKNHVKTNKKPFACDDCSASFKRSSHLSRHKLIHTGERPFRCCMCDKAFSRLDKLKQHARNTHDTIVTNELLQENAGSSCKYIGTDVNDSGRRKSRGRPRKSNLSSTPQQENETSNPDETFNLPFGDLNWYLTMPETETEAETETDPRLKIMEPVVEIKTETAKSKVAFGKIGQCTVSVGNYT